MESDAGFTQRVKKNVVAVYFITKPLKKNQGYSKDCTLQKLKKIRKWKFGAEIAISNIKKTQLF